MSPGDDAGRSSGFEETDGRPRATDGGRTTGAEVDPRSAPTTEEGGELSEARHLQERVRDLTRRVESLESSAREIDHDVRNPLLVASHHLTYAREEPAAEHFDAIERAHERIEALLGELRAAAEGTTDRVTIESVPLATLAQESWRGIAAPHARLRIEDPPTVLADRSQLLRLLENLFRNAIQHATGNRVPTDLEDDRARPPAAGGVPSTAGRVADGDSGVTVWIGACGPDGFYVADDGPGIPAGDREGVFAAGYTSSDDGSGLGLSIVRDVVREHGWTIAITRSAAGGARFEITGVRTRE